MLAYKFLVKCNELPAICHIPIRHGTFGSLQIGLVRLLLVGIEQEGLPGNGCGQFPVFPGPFVIEPGQEQSRLRLGIGERDLVLQILLYILKLMCRQIPYILQHVVDAVHPGAVCHGKQLINGDSQLHRKLWQQLNIRHGGAAFPF